MSQMWFSGGYIPYVLQNLSSTPGASTLFPTSVAIEDFTNWYWNLPNVSVEFTFSFTRYAYITSTDPSEAGAYSEFNIYLNGTYDNTFPSTTRTLLTPMSRRISQPGPSSSGTDADTFNIEYYETDQDAPAPGSPPPPPVTSGPGELYGRVGMTFNAGLDGTMGFQSGSFYPETSFTANDGSGSYADFPVPGFPGLYVSTGQFPAPVTSGGDPSTDPSSFDGGIPWDNVGSITVNGYSFPLFGYTGSWVTATDTSLTYVVAGYDTLIANATVTIS